MAGILPAPFPQSKSFPLDAILALWDRPLVKQETNPSVTAQGNAPVKLLCQCADPGCPHCAGHCKQVAIVAVLRVDMEDRTGTPVCRKCAEDCMESGLFRESVSAFLKYHKPIAKGGAK